jgi:FAD:protein FMN transferase
MGTVVSLEIRTRSTTTEADERRAEAAVRRAWHVLREADRVFSTYRHESPVSRLRRGEIGVAQAPAEVAEVVALCRSARDESCGWFDAWALPGGFDPTGLVKGWAAARALAEVERDGFAGAMLNAGGDIAVFGEPAPGQPWRIGIRDPTSADRLIGVLDVTAGAVATSGTYERGLHVIDPSTGRPATALLATTVTGPDLTLADVLATALLASGGRAVRCLEHIEGYEALMVGADGSVRTTPGFPEFAPVPAAVA